MGSFRETKQSIEIAAAASDNFIDAQTVNPLKQIGVHVSSGGVILGAGTLDWELLFVHRWDGEPFKSEPLNGVVVDSGSIAGAAEVSENVWHYQKPLPSNNFVGPNAQRGFGPAIVLKVTNNTASDAKVYVSFLSETLRGEI